MKPLGVNRVTIAVKDLEAARELYAELLGASFHTMKEEDAEKQGVRVLVSWDAGIELVSPIPGRNSMVEKIIETRGEGVMGVVFNVDDVDASKVVADKRDILVWDSLDYSQQEIDEHLQGRFSKYKEYFLGPGGTFGAAPVIGEITEKE